ncbi:TIM barrel protein [Candidatus Woesearchaeota archaeon]|nr:TIM barrel protein [Candidatus Woesearchaeota archaeon]
MAIKIGPAGSKTLTGLEELKQMHERGLRAMEIEFTYQVWLTNKEAEKVGNDALKAGIFLSVHAPYYINLNSEEKAKIEASKKRILSCCERGHYLNGKEKTPIVFHAAFYGKSTKEQTYNKVKEEILDMQKTIKKNRWNVILAPETTGKPSQFGDLDELLKLSKETGCSFTIDFAHMKARNNGKINYKEIMEKIKGKKIHSHFSGIEYTPKGEKRHKITPNSEIKELLKWIRKYRLDITIINESPDPYGDSLKTLKL